MAPQCSYKLNTYTVAQFYKFAADNYIGKVFIHFKGIPLFFIKKKVGEKTVCKLF